MMAEALVLEQIEDGLKSLPGWSFENDSLTKEFLFDDFSQALGFLVRVGIEAEKATHHPEIFNVYSRVSITLRTHDIGNKVSDQDISLAQKIESLV